MIKSRIIVTGATGKTGSVVVAELLKVSYPVRTMVRREDGRSAQLKQKGRLMKLFKIAALFLLSISTHAALPRRLVPYVRSARACEPYRLNFCINNRHQSQCNA